jgi:hypothetical protein
MDQPTPTAKSKRDHRIQTRSILLLFLIALLITLTSHHLVNRDLHQKSQVESTLLSVPKPREAAKGGLPPIPDFVKKKTAKHHRKEMEKRVEAAKLALEEAQAELAEEDAFSANEVVSSDNIVSKIASAYPPPYELISPTSQVLLQPTLGSHRPNQNAIFAFAEGYPLDVYITFIESLSNTGYTGDVVLAVSSASEMKPQVLDYLTSYADENSEKLHVISYALSWECYRKNGERITHVNNGFSDCQLHGLYSTHDGITPAKDVRMARPVATARYELYWIWSTHYEDTSRILILDVRDSYFQSNPFSTATTEGCTLDLFEENREAVSIGKSSYNSKWVQIAYGKEMLNSMKDQPVLCSGSTMGSQKAIETYTLAMISQFDERNCKQVGCDQGFHNYLFYDPDAKLRNFLEDKDCVVNVHKQGEGTVNNLAAMRNSSLRSQGVLLEGHAEFEDGFAVVNMDRTVSPVMHQFDRDGELKGVIRQRTKLWMRKWMQSQGR